MMESNSIVKGFSAAKEVITYIKSQILTYPLHEWLVIILKDNKFTLML
jgi:hypothetical protein